jgi:hypothetical protein
MLVLGAWFMCMKDRQSEMFARAICNYRRVLIASLRLRKYERSGANGFEIDDSGAAQRP